MTCKSLANGLKLAKNLQKTCKKLAKELTKTNYYGNSNILS